MPSPRDHALYADKRVLALLGDKRALAELGVRVALCAVLVAGIPASTAVHAGNAAELWRNRRQLFFKPALAYGSGAATVLRFDIRSYV